MNPSTKSPMTPVSPMPFLQSMTKQTDDGVAVEIETDAIKQPHVSFSDTTKSIRTNNEYSYNSNHSSFNKRLSPYSSKNTKQRSANSSRLTPISLSPYVYSLSMNSNSNSDQIPYYDEDEILETEDVSNDMKKLLFQPKWAKKDELLEYEQLSTNKYYAAHKDILDNMKYSQNMVMEKVKRKQRGKANKPQSQRHPFEMFLDEVNGIYVHNNYARKQSDTKPALNDINSMSTLGPSASVLMNDDSNYTEGDMDDTYTEWSVVKPTQQILQQLNLQTNNNLLLKEVQRLRNIVSRQNDMSARMDEKDFQIKTLRSTTAMLMEKVKLLQRENSRLTEIIDVKQHKKNKKYKRKAKHRTFAASDAKKEHMKKLRNRTTPALNHNINCSKSKHVHF